MRRYLILSLMLVAACHQLSAQSVDGIWKGKLVMQPGGCFPVYHIELQIHINGTTITGNSYHYSDTANYVKEVFEGTYDTVQKIMIITEKRVATFRIPADCTPCIKKYTLSFHTDGKEDQLRGSWTGKTLDKGVDCPPGSIVMTRAAQSDFKELPKKLADRKLELVKEIFVDTGSIRLDFYDNGQIDGDTISVYVGDFPVISNKMLSIKPISTTIHISLLKQQQDVVMVGENLGSIPPNTALMIVHAGNKRYQLYLTSDDNKNALVRFIYKKPG